MTVDSSKLSAAELAADLEDLARDAADGGYVSGAAVLREAARRIAPATAALADVPPRLEVVGDAEQRAAALLDAADRSFG